MEKYKGVERREGEGGVWWGSERRGGEWRLGRRKAGGEERVILVDRYVNDLWTCSQDIEFNSVITDEAGKDIIAKLHSKTPQRG